MAGMKKADEGRLFLFNLSNDPTESSPLNDAMPEILAERAELLRRWEKDVARSQIKESFCARQP